MAEQLTFDLPVRVSRNRGDFFVSDANAMAVTRLDAVETWPNGKLVLVGPEGAGKTHLAHVWTDAVEAVRLAPGDLTGLDVPGIVEPVVLDEVAELSSAEQEALFHLHNHMGASGLPLLIVARLPPAQWDLSLPDLKSRMVATDTVRIDPPDDALLAAVLVKLFADRQLDIPPSLIDWLLPRMDRSFAEAQRLVAALDAAALAEGRAVTRAVAQRVLDNWGDDAP